MDTIYGWAQITKTEDQPDGTVIVHGGMTSSDLDRDKQRFAQSWLDQSVPRWFDESGNIREQHDGKRAAGAALAVKRDDSGRWDLVAHVVDPVAVAKVKHKVYKGFSIGVKDPHITYGKADAPAGEIDGGFICETSLVDRPSNPGMVFTMVKADIPDQPVYVNEVVKASSTEDPSKHPHAPAGSPQGGQFAAGGGGGNPTDTALNTDQGHTKPGHGTHATKGPAAAGGKGKKPAAKKPAAAKIPAKTMSYNPGSKTGPSGPQVKALQEALARLKITDNNGKGITVTGSYGPETVQAVNRLQQALGMTADGKVTPAFLKRVLALKTLPVPKHHKADVVEDEMLKTDLAELLKFVSEKQRSKDADSGVAMPNGDFPISDKGHLSAALGRYAGYTGDKAAAKAHIKKRAKALGVILDDDSFGGSSKADETTEPWVQQFAVEAEQPGVWYILAGLLEKADDTGDGDTGDTEEADADETDTETDQGGDDGDTEGDTGDQGDTDTTKVDEPQLTRAELPDLIKAAVTEATKELSERIEALTVDIAKVSALPEPGGPVQIRTGSQQASAKELELQTVRAQVAELLQKADESRAHDALAASGYADRARALQATLTG